MDRGRQEVGPSLGKTRNISGLNFDAQGNPVSGEQTTFFIPMNETREVNGEKKQLNDVGRALVILHEAIHADISATENIEIGLNFNHHDNYTSAMYNGIVDGLKEFNKANEFGLSDEQIGLVAWYGLQGSPLFNQTFGLDPNSKDYQTNLDNVNNLIISILYNNQNDKDESNRYNLKN